MKCREITDDAIAALKSGKWRHVRLNFPNPDMVGHTGDLDATIEACTAVDKCVKVSVGCRGVSGLIFLLDMCLWAGIMEMVIVWAEREGYARACVCVCARELVRLCGCVYMCMCTHGRKYGHAYLQAQMCLLNGL